MKFDQKQKQYQPIIIEFDKKSEAETFFNLIDKLLSNKCNNSIGFTARERGLLNGISNARTNLIIDI